MPQTQIAAGRGFTYLDNLGRIGGSSTTFWHPCGLGRGENDVLYVLNWGNEFNPSTRITKCTLATQEFLLDIGSRGDGDGEFEWPGGLAVDSKENLYVTDQSNHKVVAFTKDGEFVGKWGTKGSGQGQFYKPNGIVLDQDENFYIVDSLNNRVQRYTKDGQFLGQFGEGGSGDGQFNRPWGVGLDPEGNVYVADWGNNRVQKLSPEGRYLATFGRSADEKANVDHPSAVAVDKDGDVYVADWGNHRVIIYEPDGTYLATIIGDATNLSRWAQAAVDANPDLQKARERVDLEPEWRLWHPAALHIGDDYKILIGDLQHMRVQVYEKEPNYMEAQFTL
ncbi:MAG: NHL repeat-containing protein [Chloroflexi bacterium]|nr:NHL repeat-containing protein [Chloroflexota bacterium]